MDSLLFTKNPYFDSTIEKLISNEIDYNDLIQSLYNKKIYLYSKKSEDNFIYYFINCLHLSFNWIIYNNLLQSSEDITCKLGSNNSNDKINNKTLETNLTQKNNEEKIDNLILDDLNFPKLDNKISLSNPSNKNRRIKPTLVKNLNKNKIFDKSSILDSNKESHRKEIEIMAKEIVNLNFETNKIDIKTLNNNFNKNLNSSYIIPSIKKLTLDKEKFNNFNNFYFKLIKLNLVSNILNEIDYLIQIISKKVYKETTKNNYCPIDIFSNYHNCIYFAVCILQDLYNENFLSYVDVSFLKNLSYNENIRIISPELQQRLLRSSETKDKSNDISFYFSSLDYVRFQPENCLKESFLNYNSYQVFRKQRDAFFKLYYEWKQFFIKNNFQIDSIVNNHEIKFSSKIYYIFNLSNEFSNNFHLAKLFLTQLMQCCVGTNEVNSKENINNDLEKKDNLKFCENKLKKLNKRFNIQDQKSMATQSSFFGEELFFYEFITISNNYCFLTILRKVILDKISELNDPNLLIEMIELDENNTEIISYFCINLLNLQLLAKFLGLIVFMPFHKKHLLNLSEVNNDYIQDIFTQKVNLSKIINDNINLAIKRKHLILTLPWVIQFLNQIDLNTSLFIDHDETIQLLINIYYNLGLYKDKYQIKDNNYNYLILLFGNFFDNYFVNFYQKLSDLISNEIQVLNFNESFISLDNFILINEKFINKSFPRLFTIKETIKYGIVQNIEFRKIKPLSLSSIQNKEILENSNHDLMKLEFKEHFFKLHPESLRKTVEFVTDSLYSKCIKKLRYEEIEKIELKIFKKYDNLDMTKTILKNIWDDCFDFIGNFIKSKISKILFLLLSEHDFNKNIIKVSTLISFESCFEKCCKWVSNNLNDDWIINETIDENKRRMSLTINKTVKSTTNQNIVDISSNFNKARNLICKLIFEPNSDLNLNKILELIDEMIDLRANNFLPSKTHQCIDITILDLVILLIANKPQLCDYKFFDKILQYYKKNELNIKKFISPRNIYILSLSTEPYHTWNKYESCLVKLVKNQIYNITSVENDILCSISNKQNWDEKIFKKLASCIKSATDTFKTNLNLDIQQIELVDWLSWFCGQSTNDV